MTDQCTQVEVATWHSIPFTPEVACSSNPAIRCQVLSTIFAPTGEGPWPLFVLVAGAEETPNAASSYIDDFGLQIAGRGAVVMRAHWRRGPRQGGGYPTTLADVACAIGVARNIGPDLGADPTQVTLVGHSNGGWASSVVGLTPTAFVPAAGECNETTGSPRPDAWVAMAPALEFAESAIGGTSVSKPAEWAAVDVMALAAKQTAPADQRPDLLIQGGLESANVVARTAALQEALTTAGYDSTLLEEPDADHPGILFTNETLDALMALAAR